MAEARDIRPFGTADGKTSYWVKYPAGLPGSVGCLALVVVDELGRVHPTPMRAKWDDAAPTKAEVVQAHLAGSVADADRDLERRQREAPEPEEKPPPMDPATQRFFNDDSAHW